MSEFEAVKEVLLGHLHSTKDEDLQAARWQVMAHADELERRRVATVQALELILGEVLGK